MSIHVVPQKTTERSSLLTFMVIAEKDSSTSFFQISSSIDQSLIANYGNQVDPHVCTLLSFWNYLVILQNFASGETRFAGPFFGGGLGRESFQL